MGEPVRLAGQSHKRALHVPEEVEETHRRLFECDDPAVDEVFFVPIWSLPNELTGAPHPQLDCESDED